MEGPENRFLNASFERGREFWWLNNRRGTTARFTVDNEDAAAGGHSALVTIDTVEEMGTMFGQTLAAGQQGKTYTFAVFAKAIGEPVTVILQIERHGRPWDKPAVSEEFTLKKNEWTELHVTFKVNVPFPEGWFAYISCIQPDCQYRADVFRLYEGDYVPYQQPAGPGGLDARVRLFDTVVSSSEPLPADALSRRDGWSEVPENEVAYGFKGDAVFCNDRLALLLRRGARGAEVYSVGPKGARMRALLAPVVGTLTGKLASVTVVANDPSSVAVDATFKGANGKELTLSYRLKIGQVFVETEPHGGATGLRVEAPCRFAVLPDFFADDIVVDAVQLPVSEAELPGENFLLHMLAEGEGIVMAVWSSREGDVRITLTGREGERVIDASETQYGEEGRAWVAVLEGRGTWHRRDLGEEDVGKVVRLDWRMPYPAQWRVDWRRDDNLTDSWEMIAEKGNGTFEKHGWFGNPTTIPVNRKRWTTVLGSFLYPCWADRTGQGYLQPLERVVRFRGPAIIYPINRLKTTPLDVFTVVDIVRDSLGVGPCEYILDVEGQGTSFKGRATCATRDMLDGIYARGQQRERRAEVEKALADVLVFVRHIRGRIDDYVAFGHEMLAYLEEQQGADPELAAFVTEMEALTRAIEAGVEKRKAKIKTPEYVAELTEKFRTALLDYEGKDALTRCKAITSAIVVVGGNQDELVGECRMAVKILRQRAALAGATDPRAAELAGEIRRRTQQILRNPTHYEAPRH